jgi:GNAT superfamily N-acetyltransferase
MNISNDSSLRIRYATVADAELLATLGEQTFSDTFARDNTPEDMAAYLAESFTVEEMTAEIEDPLMVSFIAELGSTPVGFAQLRRGEAPECITSDNPIELARIYVLQSSIGKGVGAALMQACLEEAKRLGHPTIYLGVWERNELAKAFYQKWKFEKVGEHPFVLGKDVQTDWLMERNL